MLYFEVKDIVREHLARTTFPTSMLDAALQNGRQIVETAGNWWWMRAEADWRLVYRQQPYPINTTGQAVGPVTVRAFPPDTPNISGGVIGTIVVPSNFQVQPIDVPGFKDVRMMIIKLPSDLEWSPLDTGGVTKEEADLHYALNETGMPELALIDNYTIFMYPPFPDQDYCVRIYYYKWTENPLSNLATDDLIGHFPYALIYAALTWAYELELKDMEGAGYWRTLLGGKPGEIGYGGELAKISRHNLKRMRQDKMSITPMYGPYSRVRRLRLTQNIWLGSGGSL
jgi:hypothetical protein